MCEITVEAKDIEQHCRHCQSKAMQRKKMINKDLELILLC